MISIDSDTKIRDMELTYVERKTPIFHPSGKIFIAGGSDLWVRVFDFDTGKELECNKGHRK